MTAEDVLEMWDDSEGDIGELSSDEISDEEFELDDPNEPIMEGSDDEFSDLWVVEESEEEMKTTIPQGQATILPAKQQ